MHDVLIVGASLAGVHAAQALRRSGHDGAIAVVGAEPHLPYDRPPLSKGFLAGDVDEGRLGLRPVADPDALGIEWHLGAPAVSLTPSPSGGGTVGLAGGAEISADGIVIATGAAPRRLPGMDGVDGVVVLRSLDDAVALRAAFDRGPRSVVVIGFGFIGAEVAATARARDLDVTVLEAAATPLERVLDTATGAAIAALHERNGVDVRLGVSVEALVAERGGVTGVALGDGEVVAADVVVVGIGVSPAVAWLEDSGLTLDNGVVVDATCQAAPGIVAAGDVARWPNERYGGRLMRVEQWDNAVEMGSYAGKRLAAFGADEPAPEPYAPVPWFWSDQYDRKLQLAGVADGRPHVVEGGLDEERLVQLYVDDGDVQGALCWNRPRQAIQARQMIAARTPLDEMVEALG